MYYIQKIKTPKQMKTILNSVFGREAMYGLRNDTIFILYHIYLLEENSLNQVELKQYIQILREYIQNNRELIYSTNYKYAAVSLKSIIQCINKKVPELKNKIGQLELSRGIYGIYVNDVLKYIGKTQDNFISRFKSHKKHLENEEPGELKLYTYLRKDKQEGKVITLRPIINVSQYTFKIKQRGQDVQVTNLSRLISGMEFALIKVLKPEYNIEGNKISIFHI